MEIFGFKKPGEVPGSNSCLFFRLRDLFFTSSKFLLICFLNFVIKVHTPRGWLICQNVIKVHIYEKLIK